MDEMDRTSEKEAAMAARAMGGSAEAFEALIEAHYRAVFAIAYSRVQRWDAAEDLAQDTFLTAWRHRDTLRDPAKFPAWAMQIARNLSRNWLRSAAYRRQLAERAETEAAQPGSAAPQERAAIVGERDEAVDKAIAALPEPLRDVVVLYYLHDQSAETTGRLLGISAAAARKRAQRARALLQAGLAKEWESDFSSRTKALSVRERTARVTAMLALPPVSAELGKAAAIEAAASVGVGAAGSAGMKIAAAVAVALSVAAGIAAPKLLWPEPDSAVARVEPEVLPENLGSAGAVNGADAEPIVAPQVELAVADAIVADLPAPAPATPESSDADVAAMFAVGGVVVDSAGDPVRGARVFLLLTPHKRGSNHAVDESYQSALAMNSGADGRFRFDGIPPGSYQLGATMGGYGDSAAQTISIGSGAPDGESRDGTAIEPEAADAYLNYTLTLSPLEGAELFAQLYDEDGSPLVNAVVERLAFFGTGGMRVGGGQFAITDDDGRVSVDVPGLGAATLAVVGRNGRQTVLRDVPVDPEQYVSRQWPESAALAGVIDGDGRDGASVYLISTLRVELVDDIGRVSSSGATGGPAFRAAVGPDGYYRIDSVPVDLEYVVAVQDRDLGYLTPKLPLPPFEAGKTARFDYTLQAMTILAGTVQGEISGRPLRDLRVVWRSFDQPDLTDVMPVDEAGRFSFDVRVPKGRYIVYPRYITLHPQALEETYGVSVDVDPGTNLTADLTIPEPVSRTVYAVDESGLPVSGAQVTYTAVYENGHTSGFGWGLETNESGQAVYEAVVPGQLVRFVVSHTEIGSGESETFAGNPGDVFDPETVVLRREE